MCEIDKLQVLVEKEHLNALVCDGHSDSVLDAKVRGW